MQPLVNISEYLKLSLYLSNLFLDGIPASTISVSSLGTQTSQEVSLLRINELLFIFFS